MKDIPAALLAHYALGTTTVAHAIRIEREDEVIYRMTTHDRNDVISGVSATVNGTYLSDPGFVASAVSIAVGCDVGNLELKTLHDGTMFTMADLLGETWRNAAVLIFRYNYKSYSDGVDVVFTGTFGELELRRNMVVAEVHDLRRYLNHPVGDTSSKTCRYRLGSTDMNNGGKCMKDISSAPFTMPFTVTNVTSNQVFRDSARAEADDWFGQGEVIWLTGNNAGVHSKVKSYTGGGGSNGTFTLDKSVWLDIQVGDTGTAIVGCRKRRAEDCRDKFDNVENFGGEPDRKGTDSVTKRATADV